LTAECGRRQRGGQLDGLWKDQRRDQGSEPGRRALERTQRRRGCQEVGRGKFSHRQLH